MNDAKFTGIGDDYNACKNAIISFASYAKTNYPNARLWLAFMGNALDNAILLAGRTYDKRLWAKWCYETIGRENGFSIIKGCDEALGGNVSHFASDYLHPNSTGATYIGICVANGIVGGSGIAIYPEYTANITASGNNEIIAGTSMKYSIVNGMVNVDISEPFAFKIGTDYSSFTSSTAVDLCTMANLYFNKKTVIPVEGRLDQYNGKNYQNVPMVLVFEGNKVSTQIDSINSSNTGFETYTANVPGASLCVQRGVTFSVPAYYVN